MTLCLSFIVLSILPPLAHTGSQQGIIGLWSDNSCNSFAGTLNFGEQDPIALNLSLSPDQCGVPGATVHSYRIRQNATCTNGTVTAFNYYDRNNCTADPKDENPNPTARLRTNTFRPRQDVALDGECLALVAFNSLAFVCDGVFDGNALIVSTLTSATSPAAPTIANFPLASPIVSSHSSSHLYNNATSLPLPAQPSSSSGLSAGTSAGIGVGSAVAVLAVATTLWFFLRRWRLAVVKREKAELEPHSTAPTIHESDATQVAEVGGALPPETGGNAVHEAGLANEIHKLDWKRYHDP